MNRYTDVPNLPNKAARADLAEGNTAVADSTAPIGGRRLRGIVADVARRVVGKEQEIEYLLIALLAQGHCLLEGMAGTAKTLLATQFAARLGLHPLRISLTPDLDPAEVLQRLALVTEPTDGSVGGSANQILIADGIDQCSPKLQSQLIETLHGCEFRSGAQRHRFAAPFLVLACHNPQTPAHRPLSISDSDQFLFQIPFRYPSYDDEFRLFQASSVAEMEPSLGESWDVPALQQQVKSLPVSAPVVHYALRLVRSTRVYEGEEHDFVLEFVSHGSGPRGVEALLRAARARALLHGRSEPAADDIRALVQPVLRHRIGLNPHALKNGVTAEQIIDRLVAETPERASGDERPAKEQPARPLAAE